MWQKILISRTITSLKIKSRYILGTGAVGTLKNRCLARASLRDVVQQYRGRCDNESHVNICSLTHSRRLFKRSFVFVTYENTVDNMFCYFFQNHIQSCSGSTDHYIYKIDDCSNEMYQLSVPHYVTRLSDWSSLGFYTSTLPTTTLIWSFMQAKIHNNKLSNLIMTPLRVTLVTGLRNLSNQSYAAPTH